MGSSIKSAFPFLMGGFFSVVTLVALSGFQSAPSAEDNIKAEVWKKVEEIHRTALVVDGHNDLPWTLRMYGDMDLEKYDLNKIQEQFHTDFVRLRKGKVGAQFWSAYVPVSLMQTGKAVQVTREQVDLIHRMVKKYSNVLKIAYSTKDILEAQSEGKVASLIGIEGGHSIDNSIELLHDLYHRGARYMTLSHSKNLAWVESATDDALGFGINEFGKKVVREMNRLGMFVDISHISARAMREVLAIAKAPVIASHSSAYSLKKHPRNVPDDVLELVKANGGVVMVNFYPAYISNRFKSFNHIKLDLPFHDCVQDDVAKWRNDGSVPNADLVDVVDHIDHLVRVAGIDSVGLGSDYDGIPVVPDGLEDVSKFPEITAELLIRGYSESDIKKILGGNLMRAFAEVEKARCHSPIGPKRYGSCDPYLLGPMGE